MNEKNYFILTSIRKVFSLFLMLLFANVGWGQVDIITPRDQVTGFPTWSDNEVAGTNYLQLLKDNSVTITPSMNFNAYTNETLRFKARTFGGANAVENVITLSISVDNGSSWSLIGTYTPTTTSMVEQGPINISSYNGTQVKLRFTVAGTSNSIGSGIDDISIKGILNVNEVPVASNVEITGLPNTTVQLTGTYEYTDEENDVDSSTYQWYSATNASGTDAAPINDAASINYTLTNAELGKYIRFGVVPTSATGASPGIEAFSPWIGPVNAAGTPVLNAGILSDFASTCLNQTTTANSFTLMGNNLNGNITVSSSSGFTYALVENGTYTTSLVINPTAEAINTTVYVKFTPTMVQSYNGEISITGGGASGINVAVVAEGINAPVVIGTATSSNLSSFAVTVSGNLTQGCSAVSAYGIEYSTTDNFSNGTVITSTNIDAGTFSVDLTNLASFTTYYYKAFATDATGTVYGTQNSFTTTAVSSPTANAATNISMNSFTANWEAVAGVTTYELDVYQVVPGTNVSDLFISEYVEGSGNNKAIEIYNGTGSAVDLSNYTLQKQNNGAGAFGSSLALSGTLADGSTYVIVNNGGNLAIKDYANLTTTSSALTFNGNDAVALYNGDTQIDVVGVVGQVANWGADKTFVRNANAVVPTTTYSSTDWQSLNIDTFTNLGSHTYSGGSSSILVLDNQIVQNATSFVVSGLNPATEYFYVVRAKDATSTSVDSNEIEVTTLNATTVFEDGVWSNGAPTIGLDAVIVSNFTTTANMEAKSLTVTSGVFTVTSGTTLTVENAIVNNAGVNGFVVESNGVVLQNSNAVNTGVATVKRNSAQLYRQDYTLWSSPVINQNLRAFSPQTLFNRFSTYDTTIGTNGDYLQEIFTTADMNTKTFVEAKGYLIRMPNNWIEYNAGSAIAYQGTFNGILNNGDVNIGISGANTRLNLVGNPYPSPISISAFFTANNQIDETLYFWRKQGSVNPANVSKSGYATYNSIGFTSADTSINNVVPTNIETGQGFFVTANSPTPTNVVFNNAMRTNGNATFYKSTSENNTELHRYWLNLLNENNLVGQTLIGYATGATLGVDSGMDALYFNDAPLALTSLINDAEYIIQGRNLPFVDSDVVPLGFKTNEAGTFSISLSNFDGLFADNQSVYLKDNTTNTLTNLKLADYTFNTQIGIFNDRFEVQYTNSTLNTNNPTLNENNILVGIKNQIITINAGSIVIDKVELIDVSGRVILTKEGVDATSTTIENSNTANQMLILRITTNDKKVVNRKIIL